MKRKILPYRELNPDRPYNGGINVIKKTDNVRTYERETEARSRNPVAVENALSVCLSVVLVFQLAKRMSRIILSSVASLAPLRFSTIKKNVIKHKICVLSFSRTSVANITHCKTNSARCCHKRAPVFT